MTLIYLDDLSTILKMKEDAKSNPAIKDKEKFIQMADSYEREYYSCKEMENTDGLLDIVDTQLSQEEKKFIEKYFGVIEKNSETYD